jgi:hypothetical protein
MSFSKRTLLAALFAVLAVAAPGRAATLLSEDFEGFTMGPYTSATETPSVDGTDWSSELPAGWTADFLTTPVGSPTEFAGWRIHDVDSWVATEGGQDRETWANGNVGSHGSALLVDPDAYDDGTNIDTSLFNAAITTPAVSLTGYVPGSAVLKLDSFFRNEEESDLYIDVSYDGGATYSNLWTIDSAALPDGDTFDEALSFPLANPADGSLVVKFSLLEGSNDWWWAIDNVEITANPVPEPSSIALAGVAVAGLIFAARRRS